MKFLLWALVIYVAWRWYETKKAKEAGADAQPTAATADATEAMVACADCGIHLPQSEAVRGTNALHYCSELHRNRHSGG